MMKRSSLFVRRHKWAIGSIALGGLAILISPWFYAAVSTAPDRYDSTIVAAKNVPAHHTAIVFGAHVDGGRPTPYLQFRVEAAVRLYKAGRVQKVLMTGDNSLKNYDEPAVMSQIAINLGVSERDVIVDDAGFSTYDSCYRAKHIFAVHDAILVTQNYHLPRAIMACDGVGVKSIGFGADATHPLLVAQYTAREWFSTDKIVLQLATGAKSKFLGALEPIQ